MAKVLLQHYVWLLNKLMRGSATMADLADSFERTSLYEPGRPLQPRTLYNWRQKISELFNIEIVYGEDGRYHISNADDADRNGAMRWLMQSLAVSETLSSSRSLQDRILLEEIPSGDSYLQDIISAMTDNQRLRMKYWRFDRPEPKEFLVDPLCVKLWHRRWYMLARIADSQTTEDEPFGRLISFALDRIIELITDSSRFEFPAGFNAADYFRNYIGVYTPAGMELEHVRLRIDNIQRDYIDTLPLHSSQRLVEEHGDYAIYELTIHPTPDFFQAILAMGAYAEVLSPPYFRDYMKGECELLADIYDDLI